MIRVLIAAIFLTSIAFSAIDSEEVSIDNPDGNTTYELPPAPIYTDSDIDPYGSTFSSPVIHSVLIEDEGSSVWPEQDWYNDIIIYGGRVGSGQDFDVDEDTGDIYAIFDTDHTSQDSVVVYISQDGGASWSFWRRTLSSNALNMPKIRVVKDSGGQTWVCMFYLSDKTLRMRYMTPDQSSSAWTTVTTNDVSFYDADGEVGTGGWVYATYTVNGQFNCRAARFALGGTWVNDVNIHAATVIDPKPSIAVGLDGTVSVAFLYGDTNDQVRIKRSTNYGASWSVSTQVGNNSGGFDLGQPCIAYTHESTEKGWIFLAYGTPAGDNLGFHYTTNGGTSWNYGSVFPGTGDHNLPDIRTHKTLPGVTLAFNDDPGDSTMFAWALGSDPTNFTTPLRVNDYNATGNWPPTAGWVGSSAVLYTNWYVNYRLCFDWWGNVSTEEETFVSLTSAAQITSSPNPFTDMATINFSVTGTDPVSISIYNISGRLVKTIVDNESFSNGNHSVQWGGVESNGTPVVPGVYFCRLNTGSSILSSRMVMVR